VKAGLWEACGHAYDRHLSRFVELARQAKVAKLTSHVFKHENVGRFQISVHHPNLMQVLNTLFCKLSARRKFEFCPKQKTKCERRDTLCLADAVVKGLCAAASLTRRAGRA
jgi:hypothetical protein